MTVNKRLDEAWEHAKKLSKKFSDNQSLYMSSDFQEAEVRKYFLDKFFKNSLHWDVDHEQQDDPYRREVRIEKPERKAKGRADYAFSIAPHYRRVCFFVEAKRPQATVATPDNCFQAIRYSWTKGLPLAFLTDFNHLHVLDSRFRPNINSATSRVVKTWHHSQFFDREKFAEIYYLLSRDAVADGSIERFGEQELPSVAIATKQYTLFPAEARDFDEDFLVKMDEWRETLARQFKRARSELDGPQLTECVQRVLDRLIFIRFLEDKQIEQHPVVANFGAGRRTHWQDFVAASKRLDRVYNGIVFKHHDILDSAGFEPDSTVFAEICDELTDSHSPYNFDSIPVEILGRIYERFLGKVVQATPKQVHVVEKEDVRKAGGVYYTPDYIVSYMVDQTVGKLVHAKKADEILKLRVIDTACGSGSFLIGAFSFLLQELTRFWSKQARPPKGTIEVRNGEKHLTLQYKRGVLLRCIYGVDIDNQAVEVAQLSLYLKLMEEETTYSAHQQQVEIDVALLPSLARNVVAGNSLVTITEGDGELFSVEEQQRAKSLDFRATFPTVFADGGFDLVIGNPPYIKEFTNRDAFEHVRHSPYYMGKMDIWYMFACRGLDWLKPDTGLLAFIATNNWVTNAGARLLRRKVNEGATIEKLVDFGVFKVFRDADIQTMILILRRSSTPLKYAFDYRRLEAAKPTLADAQRLLEKKSQRGCLFLSPSIDRKRAGDNPLTFSGTDNEVVLEKIAAKRNFSLEAAEVAQGIVPPQDFLNAAGRKRLGDRYSVGHGIFVLADEERRSLKLNSQEQKLLKPYYTTAELGRYFGSPANKYSIIYTDSTFRSKQSMANYPNLKSHLDQFARIITSSNAPYGLHRSRDERFFVGEKIVSVRKGSSPCFTFTDFPCYVSQTFNVIKTDRVNLRFLTALLNSRVAKFWLKHRGKLQGQNFQIDKEPILALPLHVPDAEEQRRIERLVKHVLACAEKVVEQTTDSGRDQLLRTIEQADEKIQVAIDELYGLDEAERSLIVADLSVSQ